jgi:hypothetical protein
MWLLEDGNTHRCTYMQCSFSFSSDMYVLDSRILNENILLIFTVHAAIYTHLNIFCLNNGYAKSLVV